MLGRDQTSKLLSIYDAAFANDRWAPALDAIRAVTEAKGVLLYETGDTREVRYTLDAVDTNYRNIPDVLADYNKLLESGKTSGIDHEGLTVLHKQTAFEPIEDSFFWRIDEKYRARPEIEFSISRFEAFRKFVINLSEDPLSYSGVVFHYGLNYSTLPKRDMIAASNLSPHLAKAVELNRISSSLRDKYRAVLSVLDKFDLGICILNANGNVILKNARAERIFGDRDGLWMHADGSIICRDRDDTARLKDAVRRIALTADGQNDDRGDEFTIKRLSTQEPILAIASPLRDSDMELEKGLSGTLLTLIDTSSTVSARLDTFAKAYQLTPAETKVAALLFEGYTNTEIGDHLNASPETAKSHVASILRKTQCSHRINFVWRVFQFAPPVL